MGLPHVSIIIIAYNRREFLKEAILSVASQDLFGLEIEVIVVKNFMEPDIDNLIMKLGYTSYDLDSDEQSGSYLAYAVKRTHSDIICLLDDDDVFVPEKVGVVWSAFKDDPDLVYYHNRNTKIDKNGKPLDGSIHDKKYRPIIFSGKNRIGNKLKLMFALNRRGDINNSCISFRKSILNMSEDPLSGRRSIDIAIFSLALESKLKMLIDSKALTKLRLHESFSHFTGSDKFSKIFQYNVLTVRDYNNLRTKLRSATARNYLYHNSLSARINSFTVGGRRTDLTFREFLQYFMSVRFVRFRYFLVTLFGLLISTTFPKVNSKVFQIYSEWREQHA